MVTGANSLKLNTDKDIKLYFDMSNKDHLTKVPGNPNANDYGTLNNVYHGKSPPSKPKAESDIEKTIHKMMKTTTYKIGHASPNDSLEIKKEELHKNNADDSPKGRRADPNNPNRVQTFGFGFGCEKGTT